MYTTVKEMVKLGWHVTYAHLVGAQLGPTSETYLNELRALGIEFIWLEYERWWSLRNSSEVRPILRQIITGLDLKNRAPDFVYLSFWFVADYFLDFIREELPATPIIIDTIDLHYLREARQAEVLRDKKLLKDAQATKRRELAVYAKADCVTTVTEEDRSALLNDLPSKPVFIMTNIHEPAPSTVPFGDRKDLLFVGNFNHTPNQDAVKYFVESVFPAVRAKLPGVRLLIVGNNPTADIRALQCGDIEVTGWVPSLVEYFDRCRLSVAPIRYGAGVKGKIGEAIAHGLPCVLTTVAAEGMNIVDGKHALIADDPGSVRRGDRPLVYRRIALARSCRGRVGAREAAIFCGCHCEAAEIHLKLCNADRDDLLPCHALSHPTGCLNHPGDLQSDWSTRVNAWRVSAILRR